MPTPKETIELTPEQLTMLIECLENYADILEEENLYQRSGNVLSLISILKSRNHGPTQHNREHQ